MRQLQAQRLFLSAHVDAQGQIVGLIPDSALTFDVEKKRIQIEHRKDQIQRPILPIFNLVEDGIGDVGNQRRRDLYAV